jgi:peptidoglycan/xylan/chitin deacetylase (PgdA/CDA1 family)
MPRKEKNMHKRFYTAIFVLIVGVLISACTVFQKPFKATPPAPGGLEPPPGQVGRVFTHGPRMEKKVALTFDDGPNLFTPSVLEVLERHKIKGTFYLLGENIERQPDIVQRIVQQGHAVGNHTYSHPDLRKLKPEEVHSELVRTGELFQQIVGWKPKILRAPFGFENPAIITEAQNMGYEVTLWSLDTEDWQKPGREAIKATVLNKVTNGDIILMHCKGGETAGIAASLDELIQELKKMGYTMVTVPELLNIPAKQ